MAQHDPESGWRGRLDEMDQQLHALAAELAEDVGKEAVPETPALEAPPPLVPEPPAPRGAAAPPGVVDPTLEAMCGRLVASMRELLAGYELALTHVSTRPEAPAVTVAAGPFASVALLERFEHVLRTLPEVHGVTVRGYEGTDRAVLEVHLAQRVS